LSLGNNQTAVFYRGIRFTDQHDRRSLVMRHCQSSWVSGLLPTFDDIANDNHPANLWQGNLIRRIKTQSNRPINGRSGCWSLVRQDRTFQAVRFEFRFLSAIVLRNIDFRVRYHKIYFAWSDNCSGWLTNDRDAMSLTQPITPNRP
jgi:hypothetical protein